MNDPGATPGRRALGAELAAYRRAAGYTQAQLAAHLTGYTRSTIANAETGRQHVPRRFWENADRVLRTGGVLATAYDQAEAATRRDLRATARTITISRQAQAPPHALAHGRLAQEPVGDSGHGRSARGTWIG